ncbi:hypothetical protein PS659_03139 [Pseudomonas fluorescens]|uniref:Uncharacterized protein n=1 Tax=Pseudomonas fluorescens TaxID=294 RepID=A0A5E6TTN1_PSEFL|nr:hypothetical protein PS659_03139 [Pseudomonas fluorescens]
MHWHFYAVRMRGAFNGTPAIAYPTFICVYKKDHNPPPDTPKIIGVFYNFN